MNPLPHGTSGSTSGSRQTTPWEHSFRLRLAGFALAVAAVGALIGGFDTSIWRAQVHLREVFAAIRAEKFYFGVNFWVSVRKLNATLLDFRLTGNASDRESFRRQASRLQDWLQSKEADFLSSGERGRYQKLETAYGDFLSRAEPLLQSRPAQARPGDFAAAYAQIRQDLQPLLQASDEVVQADHSKFDVFLLNSDQTLLSLQRLFLLSLLLLLGLALALAVLVYRGMLAPLRAQLTESQALVHRQEKLAALGALGAGVAHEIRNPLTAIKFRLFSLKESLPPAFAENEDARIISEEIGRLDHIVKDFLQFARPSDPELVRVPAERMLREVEQLMKPELDPAAIQLRLDLAQPAWVQADTHQIKQVLINLVQNSADSIGQNGLITLRLRRAPATLGGKLCPAAILEVADTGRGIPPEVQKRLFDPFFTTKEGGTGLGLAIAARIVEKHGGVLRYLTELNQGTTFQIVLPRLEEHATENTPG